MYAATAFLLLIAMGMTLIRALKGPSVFDRILAVNMFGTATVLMVAVVSFMHHVTDLTDIALIYALISFTGTIAVLRFVEIDHERREAESAEAEAEVLP